MPRHYTRTPKKAKLWLALPGQTQFLTVDGTFGVAGLPFTSPQTIIRMLISYIISPTSAPTALDGVEIGVGIAKVSSDAFAIGSTAWPDPLGDTSYPWLFRRADEFYFPTTSLEGRSTSNVRVHEDIRTMRKITADEHLVMCIQYADVVGAPPIRFSASATRVLTTIH